MHRPSYPRTHHTQRVLSARLHLQPNHLPLCYQVLILLYQFALHHLLRSSRVGHPICCCTCYHAISRGGGSHATALGAIRAVRRVSRTLGGR